MMRVRTRPQAPFFWWRRETNSQASKVWRTLRIPRWCKLIRKNLSKKLPIFSVFVNVVYSYFNKRADGRIGLQLWTQCWRSDDKGFGALRHPSSTLPSFVPFSFWRSPSMCFVRGSPTVYAAIIFSQRRTCWEIFKLHFLPPMHGCFYNTNPRCPNYKQSV